MSDEFDYSDSAMVSFLTPLLLMLCGLNRLCKCTSVYESFVLGDTIRCGPVFWLETMPVAFTGSKRQLPVSCCGGLGMVPHADSFQQQSFH